MSTPEEGYPYLHIRIPVDEAFAGRVVARLGGTPYDGAVELPAGVKAVDFLVENYALEFKTLEQEPLTAEGRGEKIADFALEKALTGKAEAQGTAIKLSGAASQEYWRKFLGVSVRRQLEAAAKQIRSTRQHLGKPLHGAVFLVNVAAPFVDAVSFPNLIASHHRDFADAIDVVFYLSLIPGVVASNPGKAAIPFGFHPEYTAHDPFAHRFMDALTAEMSLAVGKPLQEFSATEHTIQPVRVPFRVPLKEGGVLNIH